MRLKRIFLIVGIGLLAIFTVNLFLNTSPIESACYAEVFFSVTPNHNLDLKELVNQVQNDLGNESSLPPMTITTTYLTGNEHNPIYAFRVTGEYSQNSTMINSVRDTLESIPEISRVSNESEVGINCPSK